MNDAVREAYDRIAEAYAGQRDQFDNRPILERFVAALPPASHVLDVGCGAGMPVAHFFIEHGHTVTGIDISPKMVDLARRNVPQATFEVRDMLSLQAGDYLVDGIVSLYAIFHVPRTRQARLIKTFHELIHPGGQLLLTMGARPWEGNEEDFHGTTMYWSHYGRTRNRTMVEGAGFTIKVDKLDRSGGELHQIILAT